MYILSLTPMVGTEARPYEATTPFIAHARADNTILPSPSGVSRACSACRIRSRVSALTEAR